MPIDSSVLHLRRTEVSRPKPELNQVCVRFADYFTSGVINGTTYHCRPRDPQRAIDKPYL